MSSPAALDWRLRRFDGLSVFELEAIYAARQRAFAVEQACAYLDADGLDVRAWHLAAWRSDEREPVAYARLLEPGSKYAEASIGRVVTAAAERRRGLGRELVARAIEATIARWPGTSIRISAQTRLEAFYAGFGFVAVGAPYLEDGIDHTEMLRVSRGAAP